MREKTQVTKYTCDGCGLVELKDEDLDGEMHNWYHGSVTLVTDDDGVIYGEWFAHAVKCIQKAVISALESRVKD